MLAHLKRESESNPCPLLLGQPVTIISSHGAVARLRRCGVSHLRLPSLESTLNLQSTFFHHLNGDYLGAVEVNSQKPLLLLQHLLATAALSTQGQCSNFISPQERKSYLTLSLCDSLGRNLGQFTTVLSSNI